MALEPDGPLRVVVGVDGSDLSRAALHRAALEAVAHDARLDVVHAWNFLDQEGPKFDPHYGETEARERIDAFVTEVLGEDRPDLNAMFRAAHTLKGSAAMVGLTPLGQLGHTLEDLLGQVREEALSLPRAAPLLRGGGPRRERM